MAEKFYIEEDIIEAKPAKNIFFGFVYFILEYAL